MAVASISIVALTVYLTFDRVKCYDLPRNVVVMAGSDKVFQCAGGVPFRWFVYPPSNPTEDKVIFMGERMAYDVDQQYRIYTKPNAFPYNQLDLLITDVRAKHFGTYKCQKSKSAHCAELIVMGSEPKCNIHDAAGDAAQLKCKINITVNGEPEMNCIHHLLKTSIHTVCSERAGDDAICAANVPAYMADAYTCGISVKHRPMLTYRSCEHAPESPDYHFVWPTYTSTNSKYPGEIGIKTLCLWIAIFVLVIFAVGIGIYFWKRRGQKVANSTKPIIFCCNASPSKLLLQDYKDSSSSIVTEVLSSG